jgi:hypothetical protein
MCPHTTLCVLILQSMCSHTTVFVLILLFMCPDTTIHVSSYYYVWSLQLLTTKYAYGHAYMHTFRWTCAHRNVCVCVFACVSLPFVKSAAFDYCLVIHKPVAQSDESVTLSYLFTSTKVLTYKCKRTCLLVQKFKYGSRLGASCEKRAVNLFIGHSPLIISEKNQNGLPPSLV